MIHTNEGWQHEQMRVDRAADEKEAKVKKGVCRSCRAEVSVPRCSVTGLLEVLAGADSRNKGRDRGSRRG